MPKRKLTDEQIAWLRQERAQGAELRELAEQLNISNSTVLYWTDDAFRERRIKEIQEYKRTSTVYKTHLHSERVRAYKKHYKRFRWHSDPLYAERKRSINRQSHNRKRRREVLEKLQHLEEEATRLEEILNGSG